MLAALPCLIAVGCAASPAEPAAPATNVLPLVTTLDDGVADSQVVPIRFEGRDAWLALDTGAPFTFLFSDPAGPEYVEHVGTLELGSESWPVAAYGDEGIGVEQFRGKPILGVLGLDFFLDVPTEIDYPGGRIVRHLDRELPAGDDELARIPLRGREHARALVDVVLDGEQLTLMFDTGAHDTLLVGVAGKESDEVAFVQTADGEVCAIRVGEATLSLPGGGSRVAPVLYALDFPYLERELEELQAHGLLGLTSLGWRRIVLDFEGGALRLGSLGDTPPGDR